jgi:hypothetical protein
MSSKVDEFDEVFPTLVRYVGLLCTLVLIGFCLAGYTERASPGFVPAAGMILYKTVRKAAGKLENQASEEGSDGKE